MTLEPEEAEWLNEIEWWELSTKLRDLMVTTDEGLDEQAEVLRDSVQNWSRDFYRRVL